ncbi:MAG: outer membrane protein assembly factor BamE [Endozoicomonas sp.]
MPMQKTTVSLAASLLSTALLTGCASSTDGGSKLISFPGAYKIDIQQGNVITQGMVNQLKPGMTRTQVQYVMGTPLLEDAFDKDRWDYIYSDQAGGKERTQKTLTIFFSGNKLSSIQGDIKPEPEEK